MSVTEHRDVTVECQQGREVQVEEFPGGDMVIRNGGRDEPKGGPIYQRLFGWLE